MSHMGQKQTWHRRIVMSALPPKADIHCSSRNVRFGPRADISRSCFLNFDRNQKDRLADGLVDHIISASQQAGRHFKAKRLRGLEID
jgi:hypothetical protein